MLGKLFVLGCLVAAVSASCNQLERIKLKAQWAQSYGEGIDREAFGQALWRTLFHIAPEAKSLFTRVHVDDLNSPEFNAHSMRVLGGLDMTFSLLDDLDVFKAQLSHLKAQHIERGITAGQFAAFGKALREVIPAAIGRCYDDTVWGDCFKVVADGISSL